MSLSFRRSPFCLAVGIIGLSVVCGSAKAAPVTLVLSPLNTLAQTHSHGLMSVTSTYQQLAGILTYDAQSKFCHIDVRFVVRSMTAPNKLIRAETMSKTFLDPVDFPQTHYIGDCRGNRLSGNLTLRGQTHPFDMVLVYSASAGQPVSVHAEGILNRYDWGLAGLRLAVGKNIRITNDISLDGNPPLPSP